MGKREIVGNRVQMGRVESEERDGVSGEKGEGRGDGGGEELWKDRVEDEGLRVTRGGRFFMTTDYCDTFIEEKTNIHNQ